MQNSSNPNCTPWKNGCYQAKGFTAWLLFVDGEDCTMEGVGGKPTNDYPHSKGTWKYGDFGEAHPDVVKETGKEYYNVEMCFWGGLMKQHAVVSDDGTKLTFYGMAKEIDCYEWKSDEEINAFKETGDDVNAPSSDYKIQPENQGKLASRNENPATATILYCHQRKTQNL